VITMTTKHKAGGDHDEQRAEMAPRWLEQFHIPVLSNGGRLLISKVHLSLLDKDRWA
jgi:hypothetical protein